MRRREFIAYIGNAAAWPLAARAQQPGRVVSFINAQLVPKRLQLLKLLNPKTAAIAVLVNPKNPNAADAKTFEVAGQALGVKIMIVNASTDTELRQAFSEAVQRGADALLVHVDALFNDRGEYQIADLAAEYRLPTMMANATWGFWSPAPRAIPRYTARQSQNRQGIGTVDPGTVFAARRRGD
jgi:ABC-type uncharacterized transport system substrate-binding protein